MRHAVQGLAFACASFTIAAMAADLPLVGPVPSWVQPVASGPLPATTEAAVQVLLSDQQVRLSPTSSDTYVDNRVRIQTPQGLQALGTISLNWRPDNDTITVHRLVVRRGEQVRNLMARGDEFTILRREDLLEQATLTGTLTAFMQPADLQVGDILEFSYTLSHADPVVPDKPEGQFAWLNAPVQSVHFRAQWPKQMGVRWKLRDFKPSLQESSADGTESIAFTLENPAPLLQPVGAPGRHAAMRRLELTTFQSWPEVSRRFAPLYAEASKLAANSPLRSEIERIRKASTDPKERAAAALRLAQEQVRYVLLAMNQGGLVPASADQTWERRYGDCKAKTALLLALLQGLGIEATAVAVDSGGGDGIDEMLPAIGAFDHVLVRARIGGKTYWLDGTRSIDRRLDLLSTPFFRWGLPLDARGSELVRIQPEPLAEPQFVQDVELDASGGIDAPTTFRAKQVMRGDSALAVKLSMANADATRLDQTMRDAWRRSFDGLQVTRVDSSFDEASGTMTWSAEGKLTMDWSDNGFYQVEDMRLGFKPDFTRPEGTNTEAPYAVTFPLYTVYRLRVKLPTGQGTFSAYGEDIERTLVGNEYRRKARVENAVFVAESSRRSVVPEVPAKDALAAEAGLRDMYKNVLYIKHTKALASASELKSQAGKPLETALAYVNRGYAMTRRELYAEGIADFDSAIKLEPGNVLAWGNKGVSLLELKRFDEARVALRKTLELDPQNAMGLRGMGALAQDEGRLVEAIELLGRSLALEDNSWARNRRIDACLKSGNVQGAAQDLVFMSRAEPTRKSHFETRAFALMREQRSDDVRALARAALDNQAGPAKGVVIAASLYQIANAHEDARALLNEHIRKAPSPELYMALLNLGGTMEQVAALFQQALALDPNYTPALEQLASFQLATRKYADVLQTMGRLDALGTPTRTRLVTRAEAHALLGETQRAQQSYAAARALTTSSGEFNDLCWSQARSNFRLEEALRDCESSLALSPNCAACLDSHAMVLLRMGRYEAAVVAYDKAVAARPRAADSLYGRGLAKLGAGRKAEGEADLATARGMEPFIEPRFRDSTGIQR